MDTLPRNQLKLFAQELFHGETSDWLYSLLKLNNLQLWGADVGNAYLQVLTKEKLYIVAGPEFEEIQGYVQGTL